MQDDKAHDEWERRIPITNEDVLYKIVGWGVAEWQWAFRHSPILFTRARLLTKEPCPKCADARECLQDLISHYDDLCCACTATRNESSGTNRRGYWQHQLDVLNRMKKQAKRALGMEA